jgi:hypothetical protein
MRYEHKATVATLRGLTTMLTSDYAQAMMPSMLQAITGQEADLTAIHDVLKELEKHLEKVEKHGIPQSVILEIVIEP